MRLIRKWLNAGVIEAGLEVDVARGTPQGAVISPLLANVYLHHVLDGWFAREWRPREARGEVYIVRYADDFVLGFEYRSDAERFREAMRERFASFGLEPAPGEDAPVGVRQVRNGEPCEAWGRPTGDVRLSGLHALLPDDANGGFGLGRKPVAKRVRRTLKAVKAALRKRMHEQPVTTGTWLGQVLRGWLGYYAVPTSYPALRRFGRVLKRLWLRALRRRSQRDRFSWERLDALCGRLWPRVSILHPWPAQRFAVTHSR